MFKATFYFRNHGKSPFLTTIYRDIDTQAIPPGHPSDSSTESRGRALHPNPTAWNVWGLSWIIGVPWFSNQNQHKVCIRIGWNFWRSGNSHFPLKNNDWKLFCFQYGSLLSCDMILKSWRTSWVSWDGVWFKIVVHVSGLRGSCRSTILYGQNSRNNFYYTYDILL